MHKSKLMKTNLPNQINTFDDAHKFLKDLYVNNEIFHPEDSAHLSTDFTIDEANKINKLIDQIYQLDIDPCAIICDFLIIPI